LRSYFNWTYRKTEAFFRDLFPRKPCPSFQILPWYMKKKLEEEFLKFLALLGAGYAPDPVLGAKSADPVRCFGKPRGSWIGG